jgi:hypothetical protein
MIDVPALLRRFEPILFFDRNERFVPSNARRYLEHSMLWSTSSVNPDDKRNWRSRIGRFDLDAAPGEGGIFIGTPPFSGPNPDSEFFFDLASWRDDPFDSTATVDNLADLDRIFSLYGGIDPKQGNDGDLAPSRFWYHGEAFASDRLLSLIQSSPVPRIFAPLFASLVDPLLLFYYLFFPGHDEALAGCPNLGNLDLPGVGTIPGPADPATWGSCAGEWAAIGILLAGDGNHANYQATQIGLSARDTGTPSYPQGESRVAMMVSNWDSAGTVGDHPLVFVAVGTHGLYLTGGSFPLPQFSPQDFSASSCGAYETPDAESAAENAISAENEAVDHTLEYKILGATAALLDPLGGAIVGFLLGLPEYDGMAGLAGANPSIADPGPAPQQSDQAPGPGDFGLIIGPAGVTPPNGAGVEQQVWPQLDPALDEGLATTVDGITDSLWLGGVLASPGTRPAWIPSDDGLSGYQGRWGNRVTSDPFGRRAGMFFPEFWSKFFSGLAKFLSQ